MSQITYENKKFIFFEKLFAILGLFLSTEAIFPLLRKEEVFDTTLIDLIINNVWNTIFLISAVLLFLRARKLIETVVNNKLLLVMLFFTLVSIYWSGAPTITFNHNIAFLGTACFAVFLITRFSWQQLMNMVVITISICIVLSCFFVFFIPHLGTDSAYNGAWRGIFQHKNTLGRIMVLSILSWTWFISFHRNRRLIGMIFIAVSLIMLLLSASTTSLFLTFIILAVLPLYKFFRLRGMLSTALFMFGLPIFVYLLFWVANHYEQIMNSMQKDITLTGRTDLWQALWKMIIEHPFLGYGYGAFWLGTDGPSAYIWSVARWKPNFSHNGFMEIVLQTGFIGLTLFITSLIVNLVKAIKLLYREKRLEQMFPLQFLLFTLFYNLTESTLLVAKLIFWILYLVITIHLNASLIDNTKSELNSFLRLYWKKNKTNIRFTK